MTYNSQDDSYIDCYIDSVACKRADIPWKRGDKKRADKVYDSVSKSMWETWVELRCQNVPKFEAKMWLELWYENVDKFNRPNPSLNNVAKDSSFVGPKAYANSLKDSINSIKNHIEKASRKASESNRNSELKKALNEAELFLSVSPDFYRVERHGKWLSETEYNSMMQYCKEIVAKFAAVSTLETAA